MTRSRPASASACAVRVRPSALVVSEVSGRGRAPCVRRDDVDQPAAQQRLAAGEPDLADAEPLDADRDQPDDLVVGEHVVGRAASPGPRPACSRCSAGCTGRSARRAGRWPPGRSGPPARVVTRASLVRASPAGPARARDARIASARCAAAVPGQPPLGRCSPSSSWSSPGVALAARRVAVPPAATTARRRNAIIERNETAAPAPVADVLAAGRARPPTRRVAAW